MRRVRTPELMDDPGVSREDLDVSLRYIRMVNRRLGGVSALLRHLRAWSREWPRGRPITLLDVATGSADLPVEAVRWARNAGHDLRVTAVDVHPTTLALAREHIVASDSPGLRLAESIELRELNALKLMDEFKPGSFDYVHAGLFLHHLPEIEVLTVLRIMDRLSRAGLIWNDLVRTQLGSWAITAMTVGTPRIVKHDARVSVRAGFTRREAIDLATRAGLVRPRYEWSVMTHRFTVTSTRRDAW
jgi:SAM-dependent methyltransferase